MRLEELAVVMRSKNAGAFYTTIDIFFDDEENYRLASDPSFLTPERVADAYGLPPDSVHGVFRLDTALGIKVTIRKPLAAYDPANTDVMGAQQHLPIAWLEVPGTPASAPGAS